MEAYTGYGDQTFSQDYCVEIYLDFLSRISVDEVVSCWNHWVFENGWGRFGIAPSSGGDGLGMVKLKAVLKILNSADKKSIDAINNLMAKTPTDQHSDDQRLTGKIYPIVNDPPPPPPGGGGR